MAMELQLSTSKAQAELRAVEALITRLGSSLQSISAVGGMFANASQGTNQFAGSTSSAVGSVRSLNTALSSLAGQVNGLSAQMNTAATAAANFANQANNAGGAAGRFGNSLGGVNRLLSAFGISLGAIGFARLAKEGYDMVNVFESFKTIVGATSGGAKVAEAELAHIRKTAIRLKIDIETTTAAYGKFLAAQSAAGQETDVTRDQFTRLSEVFRVMGLTADRTRLAFLAVEQMVSKGAISMEELRRQLGESVPAFGVLAQAMGITTKELDSMIRKGEVLTATHLPKLVDGLHKTYVTAEAMDRALKKPVATLTDLSNGMKLLSYEALNAFFQGANQGFTQLAEALRSDQLINSFTILGQVAGQALGIVAQGLAFAAQNAYIFVPAVTLLVTVLGGAAVAAIGSFVGWIVTATLATARFAIATAGMAILQGTLAALTTAWRVLAGAVALAAVAMGPIGKMIAVAIAVGGALALLTGTASAAVPALKGVGDAAVEAAGGLVAQGEAAVQASGALEYFGTVAGIATAANFRIGESATYAQGDMFAAAKAADKYSSSLESLAYSADRAASSVRSAASAGSGGGDSFGGGGRMGGTESLGSGWWASNVPYFGGSAEMGWAAPSFAGGGYSHAPTSFMRVRGGFGSGPKLASGSADTGVYGGASGIPAVLHPNEAVVPLPNGQSIPVSMGGSMEAVYQCLEDVKRILATAHQSIVDIGVLIKNESDRHFSVLVAINNGIYKLVSNQMGAGSGGSSNYGGGSSGGGGAGGALGQYNDLLVRAQVAFQKSLEEHARAGTSQSFAWAIQSSNLGPFKEFRDIQSELKVLYANLSKADQAQAKKPESAAVDASGGRTVPIRMGNGFDALSRSGGSMRGFATGSPNAWKDTIGAPTDATGGFLAKLHKDEAVIPLPDGRSVPVDLTGATFDVPPQPAAKRPRESGDRPNIVVNVDMKVSTQDVEGFNRSKDQMMQDLGRRINKAVQQIGQAASFDDPTRRQPE